MKVEIDCKTAKEFMQKLEPYWLSPVWRVNATSDPLNNYFHIEAIKVISEPQEDEK